MGEVFEPYFEDAAHYALVDGELPDWISGDDHMFLRDDSWWKEWYERRSGKVPASTADSLDRSKGRSAGAAAAAAVVLAVTAVQKKA